MPIFDALKPVAWLQLVVQVQGSFRSRSPSQHDADCCNPSRYIFPRCTLRAAPAWACVLALLQPGTILDEEGGLSLMSFRVQAINQS